MSRVIGARPSAAWRRPHTVRLDRDSVSDCWLRLPANRAVAVYVVLGRTAVRVSMKAAACSPYDIVGRFDRSIPLADLIEEVRHTAEELAASMNMQVAA